MARIHISRLAKELRDELDSVDSTDISPREAEALMELEGTLAEFTYAMNVAYIRKYGDKNRVREVSKEEMEKMAAGWFACDECGKMFCGTEEALRHAKDTRHHPYARYQPKSER